MPEDTIDPVDALLESAVSRFLSGEAVEIESIIAANPDHEAAIRSRWAAILRLRDPFGPMLQSVVGQVPLIAAGAHVGEYEIVREIGRGGMGIVYEAIQKNPRRPVALKVIRGSAYVDDHAVQMFQREIAALARLKHPGIAAIYGAGATEDGRHFFAMELVQGVPLLDYVRENRLTRRQQLELFIRVCEAVNYAHQRGVIHRDLKPGNILVEAGGNPKVLDFGLARVTDADMNVTTAGIDAGRILGTLPYMSPEQVQGQTDQVDIRTDVYSLGVVLYQLLTGKLPLDLGTDSFPRAIQRVCEESPIRPASVDASIREDLQTIALKAVEKSASQRYPSAGELAGDIHRFLQDQPILARPTSTLYQLRKFVHRNRFAAATVIAGLVGLSGYAVSVSILSAKLATERDRAIAAEAEAVEAQVRAQKERDSAVAAKAAEVAEREVAQAAENRSLVLLSRAEEINDFLVYLFGVPRLNGSKSTVNSAKAVLDEGRSIVTRKGNVLSDGTRAALLETLGRCYSRLGEFRAAEKLLREAVRMYEELLPESDKRRNAALVSLAIVLNERQKYDEARGIASRAVAMGRRHRPALDAQLCQGLIALGEANRQGRGFASQIELYEEAYRLSDKRLDAKILEDQPAATPYGLALIEANRAKEAAKVLAGATAELGKFEHFAAAQKALERLIAQMTGGELDFETVEEVGQSVVTLGTRVAGPEDPQLLKTKMWLAQACAVNGDSRKAFEMLQELIPILVRKRGESDQFTLLAQTTMGECMVCLDRYVEAESVLKQVMERQLDRLGAQHIDLCRTYGAMANVHARWARFDEAESCLAQVLAIRRANLPQYHTAIAGAIGQLAALRCSEGRYQEALTMYEEALDNHEKAAVHSQLLRRFFQMGIAGCQSELDKCGDAQKLASELLSELDESSRNNCCLRGACLLIRADCCLKRGEYEKAIEFANQATALKPRAGDFGHGISEEANVYIGIALIRLGKEELGERSLKTAIEELKKYSTPKHPLFKRALDELSRLEQSRDAKGRR